MPQASRQIRSTLTEAGMLELSLVAGELPDPGPDEVVVRVEASPINPSDLGLLFGPADMSTARAVDGQGDVRVVAEVPAHLLSGAQARVGRAMAVGNEGAGVVVAAGESASAQALLGRTVAVFGGAMYAEYRKTHTAACLPLPEGTTPAQGASCFINPLTALGMVETMRLEGHAAIVHTAAASNLGQMLQKLCLADGVPLVNIVRRPAQAALLRELGATQVVDSSAERFKQDLRAALDATGATLAFDAIGGGKLASDILAAMERVQSARAGEYSRYGSAVHKQVYVYGMLDRSPIVLGRNFGMAWGVGGWLLTGLLQRVGAERAQQLQQRVAAEITTTFASHYGHVVSLDEALQLDVIAAYGKQATGEKYLIAPHKAG